MSRAIRADKEAYLKLGNLQQTTSKGNVALKGWHPENARSLHNYSHQKRSGSKMNESTINRSIDSGMGHGISVSGSMKELQVKAALAPEKPVVKEADLIPNLSPPGSKHTKKSTAVSQLNLDKTRLDDEVILDNNSEAKPQDKGEADLEDTYSLPDDDNDKPITKAGQNSDLKVVADINKKSTESLSQKPILSTGKKPLYTQSVKKETEPILKKAGQATEPVKLEEPIEIEDAEISDEDEGYSEDGFVESGNGTPTPKQPKAQAKLPATVNAAASNASTKLASAQPHVITQLENKLAPPSAINGATSNISGSKPSIGSSKPSILGSKPNFMAKKRKF